MNNNNKTDYLLPESVKLKLVFLQVIWPAACLCLGRWYKVPPIHIVHRTLISIHKKLRYVTTSANHSSCMSWWYAPKCGRFLIQSLTHRLLFLRLLHIPFATTATTTPQEPRDISSIFSSKDWLLHATYCMQYFKKCFMQLVACNKLYTTKLHWSCIMHVGFSITQLRWCQCSCHCKSFRRFP